MSLERPPQPGMRVLVLARWKHVFPGFLPWLPSLASSDGLVLLMEPREDGEIILRPPDWSQQSPTGSPYRLGEPLVSLVSGALPDWEP